jgi:ABC-type sugar transport system ATPase subunit
LAVRPEDISVTTHASAPGNALRATVREVLFGGSTTTLKLDADGLGLNARLLGVNTISLGDDCLVEIPPHRIAVMPLNNAR